jgi:formylglycine-generating enzyme required for sulfatase activity
VHVGDSQSAVPECLDGDRQIDTADLSLFLLDFGLCIGCGTDLDGSGTVDAADISLLLMDFGQCPTWYSVLERDPDPAVVFDANLRAAIAATGLPWRVRDNGTGIEMVLIPPGSFMMGCSNDGETCESNEYPAHRVVLTNAFYLGRTEVTRGQWWTVMPGAPCCSSGGGNNSQLPVETVSWNDAQVFCNVAGFRLPTEAEWEFGYRAGSPYAYQFIYSPNEWPYGVLYASSSYINRVAWNYYNTCMAWPCGPRAVGLKACNFFGLFDMAGNVSEWVNDWYADYSADEQTDPQGPSSGTYRVIRGGSSNDWWARAFTASSRILWNYPDFRGGTIGFRVAKNP